MSAGTHDLGAVLGDVIGHFFFGEMVPVPAGVAVLPVPAETDLGNHQVRFAQSAIYHLRVEIENPRCVDRLGGVPLAHQRAGNCTRGHKRSITHEGPS